MLIRILLLSTLTACSISAFAKDEAYIRTAKGKMTKISHDRVYGRLSDLHEEDDGGYILCYEGSPDDVCAIVKAAVREENEKEKLEGENAWDLKECEHKTDKGHLGKNGYIHYLVKRKLEHKDDLGSKKAVIENHIPLCADLDKLK